MSPTSTLVPSRRESTEEKKQAPLDSRRPSDATLAGSDHQYDGQGTQESPYIVKFADGDETNPLNFSELTKWLIVAVQAVGCLCVAFGSSIYGGAIAQMMPYFKVSSEVITLGLSLYVLGFALGPLIWAPQSELLGRRGVYLFTYGPFAVFHIGAALAKNIETMLICRFLSGFFGSSPLTNSGGVIADMFPASRRSLAMSLFALAPFAGPVAGPIVGGFIGMNTTWRWVFWVTAIFSGVMYALGCMVPETYAPVLLRRRAAQLEKATGRRYVSMYDLQVKQGETLLHKMKISMQRPFVLLFKEVIVFLMALYSAVIYGTLYLMFGAFPIVFRQERGWSLGVAGLPFIAVGVGMCLGVALNISLNGRYVRKLVAAGGQLPPEDRLPLCCVGGVLLPVGLFWFAWTVQPSVHWIVPCLATVPFGAGMVLVFIPMMNYLIDAYLMYAASALAANAVLRSIFGAVFPLFTRQMFERLGTNWALTLVAFLSLALMPVPFIFYIYGAKIRARSSFAPGHRPPALSKAPTQREEEIAVEVAQMDLARTESLRVDEREAMETREAELESEKSAQSQV